MIANAHGAARRLAVAVGLTGAWVVLSAATTGPDPAAPPPAPEAADVLVLAQAAPRPVSFASDQADRGEERYAKDCEECHGDDLRGGLNGGAPLRGLAFEEKYFEGAPASWMFEFMSNEMPPNAPGRYSASTYADLMAYILKRNGVQTGAPLPSDLDALDGLAMVK